MSDTFRLHGGLFTSQPATWELPSLAAGERAIVLGMGGGCDVFAAVAFAEAWAAKFPGAIVMFGNFKSAGISWDGLKQVAPHVYQPLEVRPLEAGGTQGYGTTLLEQSCPRGAEGSPMIIEVPGVGTDVAEVTRTNCAAIRAVLTALNVSRVLGVDCGGDSLTGGIDFDVNVELGRDRQVLRALQASGLPFDQLLVGPGCDGESSLEAMRSSMNALEARGGVRGIVRLDDGLILSMASLSRTLSPSRTPNIMMSALNGGTGNASADDKAPQAGPGLFAVTRHNQTNIVPRSWLLIAVAVVMDM